MGQMYTGHLLRPYVPLKQRCSNGEVIENSQDGATARKNNAMTLESRQVSCNAARMV